MFPCCPWLLCTAVQHEVVTTETTCLQELKDWPWYRKNVPASTLAVCNNHLESDIQTLQFQFCRSEFYVQVDRTLKCPQGHSDNMERELSIVTEQENPKQNTDSTSAPPFSPLLCTLPHWCAHVHSHTTSHSSSILACPGGRRVPALECCPTSNGEHLGELTAAPRLG